MLVQQQQTMTFLINSFDSLVQSVVNSQWRDNKVSGICSPPTSYVLGSLKHKIHELSRCEDVSSASDFASESSSDSEEDNLESNTPMSLPKKGRKVSETVVSHPNTSKDESVLTNSNMKLLKEMGQEFNEAEALGPKVNETQLWNLG